MSNRKRDSHIFKKEPFGHYVEPEWCSRRLFEAESFGAPGACILDPAAGWGRIPRHAADAGYGAIASDIVDRRSDRLSELDGIEFHVCNFLERSPVSRPWSIVCNPPYDHIQEFCARALDLATDKVAMLVPLRRLPAAHWLQRLPLESVYLLTPRPSMPPGSWIMAGNTPAGGAQDFAWLIFSKLMSAFAPARMRWLHRDKPIADRRAVQTAKPFEPAPPYPGMKPGGIAERAWLSVMRSPRRKDARSGDVAGPPRLSPVTNETDIF